MVSEENFQCFSPSYKSKGVLCFPNLMNLYMKFHHIWLTERYTFEFNESNLEAIKII